MQRIIYFSTPLLLVATIFSVAYPQTINSFISHCTINITDQLSVPYSLALAEVDGQVIKGIRVNPGALSFAYQNDAGPVTFADSQTIAFTADTRFINNQPSKIALDVFPNADQSSPSSMLGEIDISYNFNSKGCQYQFIPKAVSFAGETITYDKDYITPQNSNIAIQLNS